jgi:hypothetical protein
MWWRWAASDTQNARERCATHPRQQSTYVDSLGRSRRERGTILGGGQQKRVEVEAIEWRSLHLHSINSKTTFRPPQCRERTGTYSACVLGVRLRYQRHGDHVFDDEKEDC